MNYSKPIKKAGDKIIHIAIFAFLAVIVTFSGCKDDDDGGDEPSVVGTYVISNAVLTADTPEKVPVEALVAINPSATEPAIIEGGTNVTPIFFGLLAEAGPCTTDPSKTAIQLKDNDKIAYVCTDGQATGDERGDWYISDGSLVILIQTEVQGQPITVNLTLKDYQLSGSKLSGTLENFSFFPSAESASTIQTVTLEAEFTKID